MKVVKYALCLAASTGMMNLGQSCLVAQRVDATVLSHPANDTWPGYHGDYSGKRHTPLTQITPQNAQNLGLAWAFQTGQAQPSKVRRWWLMGCCTSPCQITSGRWMCVPATDLALYYPPNKGLHIGNRGVGMWKDWLYFMSPGWPPGLLECQLRQAEMGRGHC